MKWLTVLAFATVLILAAGATGFFFRSTLKGKVRSWRSVAKIRTAEQFIQAGDWSQAFQAAVAANRLAPSSLPGLRILFRTATQTNSPYAVNAATGLFLHPESSFQEKLNVLSYLDLSQNDRYFLGLMSRLSESQRQQPDSQFLMIRYLLTRGGLGGAKQMLDDYFKKGGNEKRFQGLRARSLLFSSSPSDREQGQQLVATLMQEADEVSKQAFGLLWDVPPAHLRPELLPGAVLEWVDKLPGGGAKEKLIVAQLELAKAANNKNRQEEIFRKAVSEFAATDPEILCDWLTRFLRFDLILDILDEEKGRSSLALFDHRLRALSSVQGAAAAEAWLANPLPDASPLQIWISRAKLAHMQKNRPLEQKCWLEALVVAEIDETGRQFLPIFRTAVALRELEIACRALLEAASHPTASFPTSLEIQPVTEHLYRQDRLEDLHTISLRLLKEEPGNMILLNNVIYCALILDLPFENAAKAARELVSKFPKVLGLRTTLALALRKEKKSPEALSFLDAPEADWKLASPADLTIRSLVLEDCGETTRAEEVRKLIDRKLLTGSERRAFAQVFKDQPPLLDPDQLFTEIRSWIIQGGQKHAHQLLEEYFASGGNERRFQHLYTQVLLDLNYAENDPMRGQEIVAELLADADEYARKSLSLLASFPADLIRPAAFPADLLAWAQQLPSPTIAEMIAATKVEVRRSSDPATIDRILSHLIASSGKSNPEALAALLSELQRYDLILTFLDEKTARSSAKLRDFRLQALLKAQGSEAAQKWLDVFRSGGETPSAWLSTAKLRHELGDAAGTLNAFREASSLAERDPSANHFLLIYRTATELKQLPIAIRALLSASLHPLREVPSVAELTPIFSGLYAQDRLNDLHTLAGTLLNQDPSNDTMRNLQAYLSLILRDPASRAADVSADLVKRHPHILGFRTTRALALTLEEKYEEALQMLPREPEAWLHASAVDLAILALAQENMGDTSSAADTRSRFGAEELTVTERQAFAGARRKMTDSGQATPPTPRPN